MQSGELADFVPEWRYRVEVAGISRQVESMNWDAELTSALPDSIGGVAGVAPRTGTIVWAPQPPVAGRPRTPWTRAGQWPPAAGDPVHIWVGDSATSWRVFTGRIDRTRGETASLTSTIVDDFDQLDRAVTFPTIAYKMPGPYVEGSPERSEYVDTMSQPWHMAYRCLAACGWGLGSPTVQGREIIAADLQGGVSAMQGTLTANDDAHLVWGDGYTHLDAGALAYAPNDGTLGDPDLGVRVWMRWNGTTGTTDVAFSDNRTIRVTVNRAASGASTLTVRLYTGIPGSGGTLLSTATASPTVSAEQSTSWVEVYFRTDTSTVRYTHTSSSIPDGTTNGAASAAMTLDRVPFQASSSLVSARVSGRVAAVRVGVARQAQWDRIVPFGRGITVNGWGTALSRGVYALRGVENVPARDVLEEIARATLTAFWIDETGTAQWAPSNQLVANPVSRTVTTAQDVFELGWEESIQATRHAVHVNYQEATYEASRAHRVMLFHPRDGGEVTADEPYEVFIKPEPNEEWINVDTTMARAQDEKEAFNRGEGSFFDAVYQLASDEYEWSGATTRLLEKLGQRTLKLTLATTGTPKELIVNPDDPEIIRRWRGTALPILRGMAKMTFEDAQKTAAEVGPTWAPDLQHELGAWGKTEDAERIADWIARWLTASVVTLTDLQIAYDPRIQLGDVLTVASQQYLGFTLDVLVIGKRESHATGDAQMSLTVRVLRVRAKTIEYAELEAKYGGQTYTDLESAWTGSTYSQFEANPLGGS